MNQGGKLIVFEGPDGVGKTTLSKALARKLEQMGFPCDLLSFPGNDPGTLGRLIYDVHHFPLNFDVRSMNPTSRQLLHIAAHVDAIEQRILPTLREQRIVVLDRFWWSTWVYGMLSGINKKTLGLMIKVEMVHWGRITPNVAFLVERPSTVPDLQSLDHMRALSKEYERLAKRESNHYPVHLLKNYGGVEETITEIVSVIASGEQVQSNRDLKPQRSRGDARHLQFRERLLLR